MAIPTTVAILAMVVGVVPGVAILAMVVGVVPGVAILAMAVGVIPTGVIPMGVTRRTVFPTMVYLPRLPNLAAKANKS